MNTNGLNKTSYVDIDEHYNEGAYRKVLVLPIGLFALLENLVIIIMVLSVRKIRRRSHVFFVLCLSFSDLLFSIVLTIFTIHEFVFDQRNRTFCICHHIMGQSSFATSLMVTLVICLERFLSVSENVLAVSYFNGKKYVIVISAWVVSLLYMIILFLVVPQDQQISTIPHCKLEAIYTAAIEHIIYISLSALYVPFFILIIVFYTITAIRIRRRLSRTYFVNNFVDKSTMNPATGTSAKSDTTPSDTVNRNQEQIHVTTTETELRPRDDITKRHLNIPAQKSVTTVDTLPNTSGEQTIACDQNNSTMRTSNHKVIVSDFRSNQMKSALLTVTLIVLIYVICIGPSIINVATRLFYTVKEELTIITLTFMSLNAIMNPMLYVWRFADLRKELKLKCSKLW